MWRPATAQDIGKKCRVRDREKDAWRFEEGLRLKEYDAAEAAKIPFYTSKGEWWFLCEVWDDTRTEITWENIKDDDVVDTSLLGPGLMVWECARQHIKIVQPKPKTVITKQMILDKFGLTEQEADIQV